MPAINFQISTIDEAGIWAGKEDDAVSHFIGSDCPLQGGNIECGMPNHWVEIDAVSHHCSFCSYLP
jgi:hypothetical protein